MEEQKEVKENKIEEKKEAKEVKKEKEVDIGFDAGMESIGESLNVDKILDNIYVAVDN